MVTIKQLVKYLNSNKHLGRKNPIAAKSLAQFFGISDGKTEVQMRNIIKNAIQLGELIGSTSKGYYIIDNLSEIEMNLNSLQERAEKIIERRRNLRNNWNNKPKQNSPTNLPDLIIS